MFCPETELDASDDLQVLEDLKKRKKKVLAHLFLKIENFENDSKPPIDAESTIYYLVKVLPLTEWSEISIKVVLCGQEDVGSNPSSEYLFSAKNGFMHRVKFTI